MNFDKDGLSASVNYEMCITKLCNYESRVPANLIM